MYLSQGEVRQLLDNLVGGVGVDFGQYVNVLHAGACTGDIRAVLTGAVFADINVGGDFGVDDTILAR